MSDQQHLLGSSLTRRGLFRLAGVTTGGLAFPGLLAACGGDDGDAGEGVATTSDPATTETTGVAGTTTTGAGTTSGELTIAAPQDRYRTEPNRVNIGMSIPNTNVYETLVFLTPDFEVAPRLAESWEFVEPKTWRFALRKEVTFHDGTPFTAEAVNWTMARIVATGGGVFGLGEDSVKVIDDYTVEITPETENRRLLLQLSATNTCSIIAPDTDVAQVRIGTGPFKEVEYVRDQHFIVEANETYWGEDKPMVQRLTFNFMPDPTTRMLAFQAGEADVIFDVPRESAAEVTSMDDMQLATSKVGAYEALYFNIHGQEPYDLGQDRTIRQALAHAIDRDAIVNGVWQGNAEISNTMIPAGVLGAAASTVQGPTLDTDLAKQLLDEAGWVAGSGGIREKDGRQLKLTMVVGYPSAEIHKPMPELVQAQLKDVGIELEIVQTPDVGSYEARLQAGEGDLWAEVGNQVDADPCYLPGLLFYSPLEGGDPESAMYANAFAIGEAFDTHIDTCGTATTTEEIQQAAANAMKVLIDDEYIVIPLAGVYRLYGVSEKVQGFEAHPVQFQQRWTGVSVADA